MNIFIFEKWGNKITGFDQTWTTGRHWYTISYIPPPLLRTLHAFHWILHLRLDRYAASTAQRGSPVTDLIGWVDGTYVQGEQEIT